MLKPGWMTSERATILALGRFASPDWSASPSPPPSSGPLYLVANRGTKLITFP